MRNPQMREHLKSAIRSIIRACGYDLRKLELGCDAFLDIRNILAGIDAPVIFDVGANTGQTIAKLLPQHPRAIIHAFEPGRSAFSQLSAIHTRDGIYLNHIALGALKETRTLYEYAASDVNSLLPRGGDNWFAATGSSKVAVDTVDDYCTEHSIERIDLLKSDTQGFDLEVLKGADRMLSSGRIGAIYLEITFAKLYQHIPRLDELYAFISDRGFDLVSFYKMHFVNGKAGWTDALFTRTTGPCPSP
jgi:FkbM family methyltransferase